MRTLVIAAFCLLLASPALASARENRDRGPREKANPVVQTVKKIIKVLGDGLTIPNP